MHLPAIQSQLVAWCRYRRQLPLVIVELFGGVKLAVLGDCHGASREWNVAVEHCERGETRSLENHMVSQFIILTNICLID